MRSPPTGTGHGPDLGGGRPCVVVLAAGHGRRLGLGPKALVRVGGISLAGRAVEAARAAGGLPVLVVGPSGADVVATVRRESPGEAVVVHVADPGTVVTRGAGGAGGVEGEGDAAEMSHSWRAGVERALAARPGRPVVVTLVDQPGVNAAVLTRLLAAHEASAHERTVPEEAVPDDAGGTPGAPSRGRITRAVYAGRPGHPVVLDPGHARAAAAQVHGDAGAREYLRVHRSVTDLVECADLGTDDDLDTPADLARWRGRVLLGS